MRDGRETPRYIFELQNLPWLWTFIEFKSFIQEDDGSGFIMHTTFDKENDADAEKLFS